MAATLAPVEIEHRVWFGLFKRKDTFEVREDSTIEFLRTCFGTYVIGMDYCTYLYFKNEDEFLSAYILLNRALVDIRPECDCFECNTVYYWLRTPAGVLPLIA